MSERRTVGLADISGPSAEKVRRVAAEIEKRPTEKDLEGTPGFYREYVPGRTNKDGTPYYVFGKRGAANDGHGKMTKHAHELGEMMRPSWEEAQNKPGNLGSYGGRGRGRRCMVAKPDGTLWRHDGNDWVRA